MRGLMVIVSMLTCAGSEATQRTVEHAGFPRDSDRGRIGF
ncbi:hypothetical protein WM42_1281 [Corynebacterium simulans]|nr:hypothetical protein WM42_1281 [Corynebacterium simulans]